LDDLDDLDILRVIPLAEKLGQRGDEPRRHELSEERFRDLARDLHKTR
jgi:hypothetical protein